MKKFWVISFTVMCLMMANLPSKAQTVDYFIHTVRWYEGIKDISKKYDVPVEVIMEVNGLEKPKVKSRMKLKIPVDLERYYREKEAAADSVSKTEVTDTTAAGGNELAQNGEEENYMPEEDSPWSWASIFGFKKKVTAALVLPLSGNGSNDIYYDFYSGALLAAKELGETGIDADITVTDLSKEALPPALADKLDNADFIIGPVSEKDLKKLLALNEKTTVISPLDPRAAALADSTENFIQAPSPTYRQYADLAEWVLTDREYPEENLVVIYETGATLSGGMKEAVSILDNSSVRHTTLTYSILEGRNITSRMESAFKPEVKNRVIVLSENEAFVNDVVRNLNLLVYNKFDITLYSSAKIRSYDTIDIENLHSLNLHVSTSYFIDYDDPRVKRFVLAYRALYGTEPTQFSFQGYDVLGYFVKACHDSGNSWPKKIVRIGNAKMLQADFKFIKATGKGGFVNTGIRRIIYGPDYSVKELLH